MKNYFFLLAALFVFAAAPAWAQRVDQLPPKQQAAPAAAAPSPMMLAPAPAPEPVSSADRIAAVVNDNIITTNDIEARLKLAFLASGLPDTAEVRQRLLPQILRGLIDEQLELQEAKKLDITITKEDLDKGLKQIAADNHINGDMRDFIREKGGSVAAMEAQVRAGLAWNRVIQRELRPQVDVGDDEIDAVIARMKANAGKQEFLVSEIFLAVDNPKDEEQVRQVAENLTQQIKGGANFAAVARQFSQSTGAATGGDIGWIQEGQLPTDLNQALEQMQPGQIAGPIRSANGYHILALREKRTISLDGQGGAPTLDLRQAFRTTPLPADRAIAMQEAQQIRTAVTDCGTLDSTFRDKFPDWIVQSTDGAKQTELPPALAAKVADLPVGKATEPLDAGKGVLVVFVCGRHVPDGNVNRSAIMSSIGNEKLELQARRLQRDLRRDAYLDIRIGKPS